MISRPSPFACLVTHAFVPQSTGRLPFALSTSCASSGPRSTTCPSSSRPTTLARSRRSVSGWAFRTSTSSTTSRTGCSSAGRRSSATRSRRSRYVPPPLSSPAGLAYFCEGRGVDASCPPICSKTPAAPSTPAASAAMAASMARSRVVPSAGSRTPPSMARGSPSRRRSSASCLPRRRLPRSRLARRSTSTRPRRRGATASARSSATARTVSRSSARASPWSSRQARSTAQPCSCAAGSRTRASDATCASTPSP